MQKKFSAKKYQSKKIYPPGEQNLENSRQKKSPNRPTRLACMTNIKCLSRGTFNSDTTLNQEQYEQYEIVGWGQMLFHTVSNYKMFFTWLSFHKNLKDIFPIIFSPQTAFIVIAYQISKMTRVSTKFWILQKMEVIIHPQNPHLHYSFSNSSEMYENNVPEIEIIVHSKD